MENKIEHMCCSSCGKIFNHKGALNKHINKKNPCNEEQKILKKMEKRRCKYCNKVLARIDSLKEHLLNCKIKKANELKGNIDIINVINIEEINKQKEQNEILAILMKEMVEMKQKQEQMQNKIIKLESENINLKTKLTKKVSVKDNNGNLINGDNTNNIQQNINNEIKILAYGKEDLSFITDDVYKVLLNKGFKSVQNLVEYIHMNDNKPENQNIYISNMRDNYVLIFDGIDWRLKERDDILQEMVENKTDILTDKFEELIKTLDESTIKKFKRFIDEKDEDNVADQIKKDLKLILYNKKIIKEPPTKLITNTNKENIIHEHPKPPVEIEDIDKSKDDIIITTYRKRRSTIK